MCPSDPSTPLIPYASPRPERAAWKHGAKTTVPGNTRSASSSTKHQHTRANTSYWYLTLDLTTIQSTICTFIMIQRSRCERGYGADTVYICMLLKEARVSAYSIVTDIHRNIAAVIQNPPQRRLTSTLMKQYPDDTFSILFITLHIIISTLTLLGSCWSVGYNDRYIFTMTQHRRLLLTIT